MEHFLTIVLVLSLAQLASAQTSAATPPSASGQNTAPQTAPPQPPELAEATQLSTEVARLYREGKFNEALPLARRAVELRERALGQEHQLVALALYNLASVQRSLRRFNDAESNYRRALEIHERLSGPDSLQSAATLDALGVLYSLKGDARRAEATLQRSLAIRERALGADHAEVVRALENLAQLHQNRGDFARAEPLRQRIVGLLERLRGPSHPDVAQALQSHACVLRKRRREAEAERLEERASVILWGPRSDDDSRLIASDRVIEGRAISKPAPAYPAGAREARVSGQVTVRITVDETGRVINACAISGPPLLMQASEWAAYQARFTPTYLDGQPVKVSGIITYNFVLR